METQNFSSKFETILPNGKIIYDGIEGLPEEFPLTTAEIAEINSPRAISSAPIPTSVSMRQARLALLNAGLLSTITAAINTRGSQEALIEWEFAATIDRGSNLVTQLAASLNLTEEQLDNLFYTASIL